MKPLGPYNVIIEFIIIKKISMKVDVAVNNDEESTVTRLFFKYTKLCQQLTHLRIFMRDKACILSPEFH